jgi:hypothetical protein
LALAVSTIWSDLPVSIWSGCRPLRRCLNRRSWWWIFASPFRSDFVQSQLFLLAAEGGGFFAPHGVPIRLFLIHHYF